MVRYHPRARGWGRVAAVLGVVALGVALTPGTIHAQEVRPGGAGRQDEAAQDFEERLKRLEDQLERSERREGKRWSDRLTIMGFADIAAVLTDNKKDDDASTFVIGQFDLFFTAQLMDRLSFLGECVIEASDENEPAIDLERVQLKYQVADELNVAAGRFHTALGYWNQTYHHGALLYPSVNRPLFYEFEDGGGLLPVHSVGLEFTGFVQTSGLSLSYAANVANGRGHIPDEIQTVRDRNKHKAVSLNMGVEPDFVSGLRLGAAIYHDEIPPDLPTPGREEPVDELIMSAYAVYQKGNIEVLAEYFRMLHRGEGTVGDYDFDLFYVQVSYEIQDVKPYYRYEDVRGPKNDLDPFFGGTVTFYQRHSFGAAYRVSASLVLKAEVGIADAPGGAADQRWMAFQAAFGF